jgi:protein involved in polysaccharide export with SLBB domain
MHAPTLKNTRTCTLACVLAFLSVTFYSSRAESQELYELEQGDRLKVAVVNYPELSGEFVIDSDGMIAVPLIGPMQAGDRTLQQLQTSLSTTLQHKLGRPAAVGVDLIERRPFYILGDVRNSGAYPFQPGMSVLNAVALAGGLISGPSSEQLILEAMRRRTQLQTDLTSLKSNLARYARMSAEISGLDRAEAPARLTALGGEAEAQTLMASENKILEAETKLLSDQIRGYQEAGEISQDAINAYEREVNELAAQETLVRTELEKLKGVEQKGLIPRTRPYELRKALGDIAAQRLDVVASIARTKQGLATSNQAIHQAKLRRDLDLAEQIADVAQQIGRQEGILSSSRLVEQLNVRAGARFERTVSARFEITRKEQGGYVRIAADELAPLRPGDVVKARLVTGEEPTNPATVNARLPAGGRR